MANGVTVNKKAWNRMKKNLLQAGNSSVDVGWFGGKLHSTTRMNTPPVSYAQLAKWLEEGHVNGGWFEGTITPPIPFMRAGFAVYLRQNKTFAKSLNSQIHRVLTGQTTWAGAYQALGSQLAQMLQMIMYAWNNPANSDATVSLKGFDNPLVESGELIAAVDWRVSKRGV